MKHLVSFARDENEKWAWLQKLYKWLLLCEQWPYRIAWLKHVLDDAAVLDNQSELLQSVPLYKVYEEIVAQRIYGGRTATDEDQNVMPDDLRMRAQNLVNLDSCPLLFSKLLKTKPILTVSDVSRIVTQLFLSHHTKLLMKVGSSLERNRVCVSSYAINVNPGTTGSIFSSPACF
jgi:hypothetical protein